MTLTFILLTSHIYVAIFLLHLPTGLCFAIDSIYSRACSKYRDFLKRALLLSHKSRLKSSLRIVHLQIMCSKLSSRTLWSYISNIKIGYGNQGQVLSSIRIFYRELLLKKATQPRHFFFWKIKIITLKVFNVVTVT